MQLRAASKMAAADRQRKSTTIGQDDSLYDTVGSILH